MRKLSALIVACWLMVAPVAASTQVLDQGFINAGTACTTSGACVSAVVGQASSVTIQIVGTFSATLSFEATADGVTWVAVQAQNLATGVIATSTTAAGAFSLSNVGVQQVRVRASAYTSGGAQVSFVRGYGSVRWQGFSQLTVTDSIILGSADTNGIRLDLESGVFACREGDDSAYCTAKFGATTFDGATQAGGYNADAGGYFAWTGRSLFRSPANGDLSIRNAAETKSLLLKFGGTPTCSSNCGTSPSVTGVDSAMRVTMGATGVPASGWVVTFNGTWDAAPMCHVSMGTAGMAVGKLPLTVVTTTTTITVVTNGTAPANSDTYQIFCARGA